MDPLPHEGSLHFPDPAVEKEQLYSHGCGRPTCSMIVWPCDVYDFVLSVVSE